MSHRDDILFWKHDWFGVAEHQRRHLQSKIKAMSEAQLKSGSFDEIADRLAREYALEPPTIESANISVAKREVEITRRHRDEFFDDDNQTVQGVAIDVQLPFKGDKAMFNVKPTTFNYGPPHGRVMDGYIETTIQDRAPDKDKVKADIQSWVASIQQYLDWQAKSAAGFTDELRAIAYQALTARSSKLRSDADLIDGLGFKIREGE